MDVLQSRRLFVESVNISQESTGGETKLVYTHTHIEREVNIKIESTMHKNNLSAAHAQNLHTSIHPHPQSAPEGLPFQAASVAPDSPLKGSWSTERTHINIYTLLYSVSPLGFPIQLKFPLPRPPPAHRPSIQASR